MAFSPEAFLIGAQKAGTTTLAYLLDQHPGITVSTPKEPHYFSANWNRGLDWYRQRFQGPSDAILLDASVSYSAAPIINDEGGGTGSGDPRLLVPDWIHSLSPNARFIYVLRDPVARTYSSYWHRVRTMEETRPFREAILADSFYLRTSDYAAQLQRYLRYYPPNCFLFVLFEDFVDHPARTAQQCFEFLGAKPTEFIVQPDTAKNPSYVYTPLGDALRRLVPSTDAMKVLTRVGRAVIPRRLHPLVRRAVARNIPRMEDADRAFLIEHFRERNQQLAELTGISIARWQR